MSFEDDQDEILDGAREVFALHKELVAKELRTAALEAERDAAQQRNVHDEGTIVRLEAELAAARQAGAKVCEGFEKGLLVRDTSCDEDTGWGIRILPYLQALGVLQSAGFKSDD